MYVLYVRAIVFEVHWTEICGHKNYKVYMHIQRRRIGQYHTVVEKQNYVLGRHGICTKPKEIYFLSDVGNRAFKG
jgi:hypothetical protein